jgi:hypothetical protein
MSSERRLDGYRELRVRYAGIKEEEEIEEDEERVPALLLVPDGDRRLPRALRRPGLVDTDHRLHRRSCPLGVMLA